MMHLKQEQKNYITLLRNKGSYMKSEDKQSYLILLQNKTGAQQWVEKRFNSVKQFEEWYKKNKDKVKEFKTD